MDCWQLPDETEEDGSPLTSTLLLFPWLTRARLALFSLSSYSFWGRLVMKMYIGREAALQCLLLIEIQGLSALLTAPHLFLLLLSVIQLPYEIRMLTIASC